MRQTIVVSSRRIALSITITTAKAIILTHATRNRRQLTTCITHNDVWRGGPDSFFLSRSPLFVLFHFVFFVSFVRFCCVTRSRFFCPRCFFVAFCFFVATSSLAALSYLATKHFSWVSFRPLFRPLV